MSADSVVLALYGAAALAVAAIVILRRYPRGRRRLSSVRRRLSWMGPVVVTAAIFVGIASLWGFFVFISTNGGECSFDEVRCTRVQEWLTHDVVVYPGFVIAAGIAAVAGYMIHLHR